MNALKKAVVAASLFAVTSFASATIFTVSGSTVTPGSGYGIDLVNGIPTESAASTLLDVAFSTTGFVSQTFDLTAAGQSSSIFTIGSVQFRESNNSQGIRAAEMDNLGVTWALNFTAPGVVSNSILAVGTAVAGSIQDSNIDYSLTWSPIFVNFGTTGRYQIDLFDLTFSTVPSAAQNQLARITLLDVDVPATAVPEPGSLGLLAIGMLGAGFLRRRMSK